MNTHDDDLQHSDSEMQDNKPIGDPLKDFIDAMDGLSNHWKENGIKSEVELEMSAALVEKAGEIMNTVNQKFIDFFKGKSTQEVKDFITPLDNSTLTTLCESFALDEELYEVCQAVKELIEEREKG